MTQSTTADNSPLQLYPPKIQGQTEPVKGAHVGVPLLVYDLISDGEGAKVQIDPPFVGIWESEDVVKLWLFKDTTLLSFTTIGDPNVPIFLRIPRNRLHPDEVNQLYYTVERNSSNVGTSEPPLTVLYNRIRPGFKDRFPEIDGHSELELDLSDLIEQGVGKDFVSAPVCFSYPYCRAYDTISLKCNGEIQMFPVSMDQAPQPPNPGSEVPTTLCFTVEREFLDKAKRLDKILNFSYTVTDQLLNGPDPDAIWSAVVAVNEDLDGTLLDKPILLERLEDFPGDDACTIELEKLANNDLLLVIPTKDDRFVVGYDVKATFIATIPGQDEQPVVVSGKVEADPFGAKKTCIIEVLNKDVIFASSVRVTYELLTPNGDFVARSNIATATVTGAHMELKPASVQQANGSTLVPTAAEHQLTIIVPKGTTLPTDLLSVSWIPEPGTHAEGSFTSDPRPISEIGLSIDIPPSVLAFCLGDKVTVSYTIIRGNGDPQPSDPFILNVQELPQAELLAPRLKEADDEGNGNELDLTHLTPDGKMWFSGFPFNAVGQFVWLLFKGTNADGSAYEKYVWAAPFAFVNDDWVRNGYFEATAPYEDLKGLKHGVPLTMDIFIAFGKSENLALAKRFSMRTYSVKVGPALVIDTSPLYLSGRNLTVRGAGQDWIPSSTDLPGTSAQRTPQSGTPPYVYTSQNEDIATVDENGVVRSERNGTVTISVTDDLSRTASFQVTVTNVVRLAVRPSRMNSEQSREWMLNEIHGTPFTESLLPLLRTKYPKAAWDNHWMGEPSYMEGPLRIARILGRAFNQTEWLIYTNISGNPHAGVCVSPDV